MPSKRLATSANESAISIEANPTAATIHGLHAPALAASAAGSAKTPLPMTWLTPMAVRSQRPSSRFSVAGAAVSMGRGTTVVVSWAEKNLEPANPENPEELPEPVEP